jgi:hypothetical protein
MSPKKHLSFSSLIHGFQRQVEGITDPRQAAKISYRLWDLGGSGLACMFFQDRSLLQFQKRLAEDDQLSNLQTLFGVQEIPEETQLREGVDGLPSEELAPVFTEFFQRLQRGKQLERYQFLDGKYLISLDGTQYFTSKKISCAHCLTATHGDKVTYSHKVLQGTLMHPDIQQVIPLMAEDIRNEDGKTKQDCEITAGKRFLERSRTAHPQLGIIVVGDGLFSKQPMIEAVLRQRMSFIFVAKPADHQAMMAYLDVCTALNELRIPGEKGTTWVYRWRNDVPLNAREDTLRVNYFEGQIVTLGKDGQLQVTYQNSWVTDIALSHANIAHMVRGGRCRWKLENECFNTLKNQGYHLEHNYGHGTHYLSFNFYLLTLLAFFMHQVAELTDRLFQACRTKFGSKLHLWETLRSYIKILLFQSWEHFLDFALRPKHYHVTAQAP